LKITLLPLSRLGPLTMVTPAPLIVPLGAILKLLADGQFTGPSMLIWNSRLDALVGLAPASAICYTVMFSWNNSTQWLALSATQSRPALPTATPGDPSNPN